TPRVADAMRSTSAPDRESPVSRSSPDPWQAPLCSGDAVGDAAPSASARCARSDVRSESTTIAGDPAQEPAPPQVTPSSSATSIRQPASSSSAASAKVTLPTHELSTTVVHTPQALERL